MTDIQPSQPGVHDNISKPTWDSVQAGGEVVKRLSLRVTSLAQCTQLFGCFFDSQPARQDGGIEKIRHACRRHNGRAGYGIRRLGRLLHATITMAEVGDHQRNNWHGILAGPREIDRWTRV